MKLQADTYFSAREANDRFFAFVRNGSHYRDDLRELRDVEVISVLRGEGYPIDKMLSDLQQDPRATIIQFQNLLSLGTLEASISEGATMTHEWIIDGVSVGKQIITGHGIIRLDHLAQFKAATKTRDECIANGSVDDFFTVLTKGLASVESFLNLRAHIHSDKNPDAPLLDPDARGKYTSTETKLKVWLPAMTGKPFEVGKLKGWPVFLKLQKLRDDHSVHPKTQSVPMQLSDLAAGLNDFRIGLAELMFFLCRSFSNEIDSEIIDAATFPTVRVVR